MVLKVVASRVPTRVNAAIAATAISADQRIFLSRQRRAHRVVIFGAGTCKRPFGKGSRSYHNEYRRLIFTFPGACSMVGQGASRQSLAAIARQGASRRSSIGTIILPIGHSARPASFRCAQAQGRAMIGLGLPRALITAPMP